MPRTRPSGPPKAHVQDGIDENLAGDENDEEDQSEWNWEAMAKMANARWGLSLRDRDLKKLGRDHVGEFLIEKARESIAEGRSVGGQDLPGGRFSAADDRRLGACQVRRSISTLDEVKKREPAALKTYVKEQVRAAYEQKEAEYPVMAGIYRYTQRRRAQRPARPRRAGGLGPRAVRRRPRRRRA